MSHDDDPRPDDDLPTRETLRVVMCRLVKSYDRLRRLLDSPHVLDRPIEKELGVLHQLADLLSDVSLHANPAELRHHPNSGAG
jgi:hypothetical protein